MGRPGLSPLQKKELWRRWKDGQSLTEIGLALERHAGSIHGVLKARGGIAPIARARSDRSLDASEQFQRLLGELGVTCSMSRAGNVWDNSAMESFFSSLKTERTARKVYRTRQDARADVFDYIERFYNPTRRHSTIGYVSPVAFEKAQLA